MEQNYTIEKRRLLFTPQHEYNKVEKMAKNTTTLPQHWGEKTVGRDPRGRPVSLLQA